ncbi:translin family protein [Aspergillus stella-maris]|uniref:translin family protein n=1 Tax=Aspergillus stella-maris TaxID=1810926 RepID=UPI003CCDBFDC
MENNTPSSATGTKRSWEGIPLRSDAPQPTPQTSAAMAESTPTLNVHSMFEGFRDELDQHHDRRERLIKISRDITALSKKMYIPLHSVRTAGSSIPPAILKDVTPRFESIISLFQSAVPEVQSINSFRYQRQLSGGIQEFIEALSFKHYLEHQEIITKDEVAKQLPEGILVTEDDYIGGLFDLTGEIMRFAVTSLSAGSYTTSDEGDNLPRLPRAQANIVRDLREIRAEFEGISIPRRHDFSIFRDFSKKSEVMRASVEKVERAAYGILVRGSERPKGWKPDLSADMGGGGEVDVY